MIESGLRSLTIMKGGFGTIEWKKSIIEEDYNMRRTLFTECYEETVIGWTIIRK